MKKRGESYPFYDSDEDVGDGIITLAKPAFDHLFTADRLEIDDLRYKLDCCLEDGLDVRRDIEEIPGVWWIVYALKAKLNKAGFDGKQISDPQRLYELITVMKNEQWGGYKGKHPQGFPRKSFRFSDDKKQIWILEDIEAALYALWAFYRLKAVFQLQDKYNHAAAVYSLTFQFILDAARSGLLRKNVFKGVRYRKTQSSKGSKKRNVNGMTPEERKTRNEKIKAAFKKWKNTKNNFCITYGKKYDLSVSGISEIIKSIDKKV